MFYNFCMKKSEKKVLSYQKKVVSLPLKAGESYSPLQSKLRKTN